MAEKGKDTVFGLVSYDNKFENNKCGVRSIVMNPNFYISSNWGFYFSFGEFQYNEFCFNGQDVFGNVDKADSDHCDLLFKNPLNACDIVTIKSKKQNQSFDCSTYFCKWKCVEEEE